MPDEKSPPRYGWALCLGGCGTPMPEGTRCTACATARVEAWKALRDAPVEPKRATSRKLPINLTRPPARSIRRSRHG
jgi:hypothetical protein